MWREDVVLAIAWFIPILFGFLVAFILRRFSGDRLTNGRPQTQYRRRVSDLLHGT